MGTRQIPPPLTQDDRLDSWKEIAAYLKRDQRTVRRWESEGLPVHRKVHKKQATVYAYRAEIDAWLKNGNPAEAASSRKVAFIWVAVGAVLIVMTAGIGIGLRGVRNYLFNRHALPIQSVAVLPLENLSGDPDQEYFADGMTEELTTELAQISALKVISHTSVVQYKGTKKSMTQIARELGVDAVVEGSVERSGDRVEITVQLIHAPSDQHLWARSYERTMSNLLDLQREVTRSITNEVKAKLTKPEEVRLSVARPFDSEAYEDYLRGRFLLSTYSGQDATKSIAYFQRAIQRDPNLALAYAGLAEAYITLGQPWVGASSPQEMLVQAKTDAKKAIAMDDSLGEAHSAFAHVIELYDWDWEGAETEYKKALELNSNDGVAHFWYGEFLQAMGRYNEGLAQAQRAIDLDPLNAGPVAELGTQHYMERHYDEAISTFQNALRVQPDYAWAHVGLGWVYQEKKMYTESLAELQHAMRVANPTDVVTLADLGCVLGHSGRKKEAAKILDELRHRSGDHYISPYLIALVQTGLGERSEALASLEQAYASRDQWMLYLKVDPHLDELRPDPRFRGLLTKLRLQ